MTRVDEVTRAILPCETCGGRGWYQYTTRGTPHSMPCAACCPHNHGWYLLADGYGEHSGRWCCVRGCGLTLSDSEKKQRETVQIVAALTNR